MVFVLKYKTLQTPFHNRNEDDYRILSGIFLIISNELLTEVQLLRKLPGKHETKFVQGT